MIAYKLFRVRRDGSIGSLYFDRKARLVTGEWLTAIEGIRQKGFEYRPGWHCVPRPYSPHLSIRHRKWYVVEIDPESSYEIARPDREGGTWIIAERMKILRPANQELVQIWNRKWNLQSQPAMAG